MTKMRGEVEALWESPWDPLKLPVGHPGRIETGQFCGNLTEGLLQRRNH